MKRLTFLITSILLLMIMAGGVALAAVSDSPDAGTVQTNGRITTILQTGDRVYLGGHFTQVDGITRIHLAAIDASTGKLTDWAPGTNGSVRTLALSEDGTRIYAGGAFSRVNNVGRKRLAAIDASTGSLDGTWKPQADATVRAMVVSGDRVYLGGSFTAVNGQGRAGLAAVDATTGALDPNWAPTSDNMVRTLALSGDGTLLYAGGDFNAISGQSRPFLTALNSTTGSLDATFRPTRPNGKVYDLEVAGGRVYTGEGGGGGAAASYSGTTGTRSWITKGDGDVQTLAVLGDKVYLGGHFELFAGQNRHQFAALAAATGALDPNWTPNASGGSTCTQWIPDTCGSSVWALTADSSGARLYAGGDFRRVSGEPHAGFAQFSQ